MQQQGAYVSVDQICREWLAKREKSIHTYWKALMYAGEAVQELTLSTLPLLQHTVLSRGKDQNWFDLPEGVTAIVSVGIPYRGTWRPIGMNGTIMAFPKYSGQSDLGTGFGEGFNQGVQLNPGDGGLKLASFSGDDFSPEDFATATVPQGMEESDWLGGDAALFNRFDTVALNLASGQIFTGPKFPVDKLYVVYVSVGTVDTMTRIPIIAKKAVEAYITWQYQATKRGGTQSAAAEQFEWSRQHKILRARLNPLTITGIKQIHTSAFPKSYDYNRFEPYKVNDNGGSGPTPSGLTYHVWSQPNYSVPADNDAIEAQPSVAIPGDLSMVIQFLNANSEYLYFAFPKNQANPTQYYINEYDYGTLGLGGTFAQKVTVEDYDIIISNFPTIITDPATFT